MVYSESVQEDVTHNSQGFWYTSRSPDPSQVTRPSDNWKRKRKKKQTSCIVDFVVPLAHRVKIKENKKRYKFGPCWKTKKTGERGDDGDTTCNWNTWNGSQRLEKVTKRVGNRRTNLDYPNYSIVKVCHFPRRRVLETGGNLLSLKIPVLGNKRVNGDHPNYNIVEIGQNTEKSPGDLRRLAVT